MEAVLTIRAVVETAIYVDDLRAAETFYRTVLGLPVIGKEAGRHVFFQAGEASVLLAFLAEAAQGRPVAAARSHRAGPFRPGHRGGIPRPLAEASARPRRHHRERS